MAEHKFEVEYAKSNRATCKQCKGKIDKGAIRVGHSQDAPEGDDGAPKNYAAMGVKWYHLECFPKMKGDRWMKQNVCDLEGLTGLDVLNAEDQKKVAEFWSGIKEGGSAPGGGSKKRAAEEGAEDLRAATESQGVLTDAEFEKYKATKEAFGKKNQKQLQAMLEKNGMVKSGNKGELLERIAEAVVLGVLPKCPECEKGRLIWSKPTGKISCMGYFDEMTSSRKKCKGPQDQEAVVRTPWKELF